MIDSYIDLENEHGGVIPQSRECLAKKGHYVEDNDDFGEFVRELCVIHKDYYTTSARLTDAYQEFISNYVKNNLKSCSISS